MSRAVVVLAGLTLTLAGCEPELGECNIAEANRIAISNQGIALYEGQAMMVRDCADGTCHADDATGARRNGVPAGLNFGVDTACLVGSDGDCLGTPDYDQLEANAKRIFDHARAILGEVEAGTMPPVIPAAVDDYYKFGSSTMFDLATRTGDTPLPGIGTAEGQEILRNWLACGAPVIGANATATDIADVGTTCRTPTEVGECVVGAVIEPPAPNWDSIYDFFSGGNCVTGCHTPDDDGDPMTPPPTELPENFADSMLDLSSKDTAYAELLGESEGVECGSGTLVVPGDPDMSLLIHKLSGGVPGGGELCGDGMPSSGLWPAEYIDPIREWIMAGAPEM